MASKKLLELNPSLMDKDMDSIPQSDAADEDFELAEGWDDSGDGEIYEIEDYETPVSYASIPSNSLGLALNMGHDIPNRQEYLAETLPLVESQFPAEERHQLSEDVEQLGDWYKCNRDSGRSIYVRREWLENAGYAGEGISDEELVQNLRGSIRGYESLKDHEFKDVQNGLSENQHLIVAKDFYLYDCMYQYDPDHGLPDAGMDNVHNNLDIFAKNGLLNVDELSSEARLALEGRGEENAEALDDSVFHTTDYEKIVFSDQHAPTPHFGTKQRSEPLGVKTDELAPQEHDVPNEGSDPSAGKHEERVKQAEDLFGGIGEFFKTKAKGLDFET